MLKRKCLTWCRFLFLYAVSEQFEVFWSICPTVYSVQDSVYFVDCVYNVGMNINQAVVFFC